VGGRVVKEYVGTGELAELLERLEEEQRAQERARRRLERAQVAAVLDGEDEVRELARVVTAEVHSLLRAAGFHRHHRGDWRRRRVGSRRARSRTATASRRR
jgi:hypothetical protein